MQSIQENVAKVLETLVELRDLAHVRTDGSKGQAEGSELHAKFLSLRAKLGNIE